MDAATTIRRELMNAIGQDRFELWFESNAHWMIEDESLVIIARDEFSSDRIRKAFGRDLQRATQKVLGVGSRVRFDVNSVESATENPSPVEPIGVSSIKVDSAVGDSNEEVLTEGCANEQDLLSDGNLAKQVFDVDQASIAVRPLVNLPNTSSLPGDSLANDHVTQKNLVLFDTSVVNASEENNAVISTTLPHPRLSEKNRRTRMSLDSFVVDPANSLAFSALQHATRELGEINPVLLHGPCGSGKSHLLQAFSHEVRQGGHSRVLGITSAQFTTDFLEALRQRCMPIFRKRYRELDLLLIDDLQFFEGKRATIVELLQTLDNLIRQGSQVVLAADRPPAEMAFLGSELSTRLSSGLVCRMDYPGFDAREEIVARMSSKREINLSPAIQKMVAERVSGDVRQINGAINQIYAHMLVNKKRMTIERATSIVDEILHCHRRPLSLAEIERAVCDVFGLEPKSLRSDEKSKIVSQPRMLAMWLSRKHTRAALSEIGDYFGGRAHSTVISANNKVQSWVKKGASIGVRHTQCSVEDAVRRIEANLNVG
jgi:chromosomal replication initiator protein